MSDFRPAGWNPDVTPVGTVTGRGGIARRRRSPVLLGLGAVLVLGAAVGMVISIVGLASSSSYEDEDVVAEGVVAALDQRNGEAATFAGPGADPFTVWIDTDGINEENHREQIIAATRCEVWFGLEDTEPTTFQGNRQGSAVTIGDDSTIGWFTADQDEITVECHQEPFGRRTLQDRLDDTHRFVVAAGKPSFPGVSLAVLLAAVGVLFLGIAVLTRAWRGRVVVT
jgi:hypothetical protein